MRVGDFSSEYATAEGTLSNGASDEAIVLSELKTIGTIAITNDNSSDKSMTIKFNDTTKDERTIKAGETLSLEEVSIEHVYLSNSSGSDIDYRIIAWGQ